MSKTLSVTADFVAETLERWHRMSLIWSHQVPCWLWKEKKHCPCMPEVGLVCAFHLAKEEDSVATSG